MELNYIEIKKSNIPNAGNGAFTTKKIKKGTLFEYKGMWLDHQAYKKKKNHKLYIWEVYDLDSGNFIGYIDSGNKKTSNWTRYVNCCRNKQEENLKHKQIGKQVFYEAKRTINPDEELLIWYGDDYGIYLGITTYHRCKTYLRKNI
jgi:hypothetical protein